ncbi:hypothetical protein FOIG_16968 [Fusarium odoratissimum NRRL 54006]|uniref:Uncharacterized protein n=1 Tax=Fusarium odoratissimum (strain NRRL 54006) TaxID=1089451 RepID=X0ILK9_FUSO5|nr:uncharacterized protein FOIG_16968 [Fusarium odoratissimum NRRL 54006]EXL89747.1 hypothetical protein FOIG_16968 [Fusarium odoratissimum NRRL 54006]
MQPSIAVRWRSGLTVMPAWAGKSCPMSPTRTHFYLLPRRFAMSCSTASCRRVPVL